MTDHLTSSVADVRKDLGDLLSRAHYQNERITVTKRDKPFASLVSVPDQERLDKMDKLAKRLGISPDELLARYENAVAEDKVLSQECSSHSDAAA